MPGNWRTFQNGLYVTQAGLLGRLRRTYRDDDAIDPVAQCKKAGLLVLDEMGLTSGGRDEFPMIHEILDYRYGERKPTILCGNITIDQLKQIVGDRMMDRLTECAFAILDFGGPSHRKDGRERYFSDKQPPIANVSATMAAAVQAASKGIAEPLVT